MWRVRLFITSYQKSGTHQIMPIFGMIPDVVDRSWQDWIDVPRRYNLNTEINPEGVIETVANLRTFKHGSNKAFGHLSYRPEYAKVLEETDTRVIFNIRDPRDVIVSEYENARRKASDGDKMPLHNFYDSENEKFLYDHDDPITELIIFAAARWPHWLGWLDHDFVLPVKYEDLRLHTLETTREIFNWIQPTGCESAEIMAKKSKPGAGNPTFRRGVPGEWKEKFSIEHAKLSMELLGDVLEKLGYG
jgi:hypothetical protein